MDRPAASIAATAALKHVLNSAALSPAGGRAAAGTQRRRAQNRAALLEDGPDVANANEAIGLIGDNIRSLPPPACFVRARAQPARCGVSRAKGARPPEFPAVHTHSETASPFFFGCSPRPEWQASLISRDAGSPRSSSSTAAARE